MRRIRALYLVAMTAVVGLLCSAAAAGGPVPAAGPADTVPAAVVPAAVVPAAAAQPLAATGSGKQLARHVPVRVPGTPCLDTARACADLSANQAWLIGNGAVEFGPVRIAHGGKGHRTPPGTFRVTFHSRHHVSSIYDAPMPYAVFFNGNIAFHQGDLGSRSHGCVRLSRDSARTFFNSLERGDVVQVVR